MVNSFFLSILRYFKCYHHCSSHFKDCFNYPLSQCITIWVIRGIESDSGSLLFKCGDHGFVGVVFITYQLFDVAIKEDLHFFPMFFIGFLGLIKRGEVKYFSISSVFINKEDGISISVSWLWIDGSFLVRVPWVTRKGGLLRRNSFFILSFLFSLYQLFLGICWTTFPVLHKEICGHTINKIVFCHFNNCFEMKMTKKRVPIIDIAGVRKRKNFIVIRFIWGVRWNSI